MVFLNIAGFVFSFQENSTILTKIMLFLCIPLTAVGAVQIYKMRSFILGNLNSYKCINNNDLEIKLIDDKANTSQL